MEPFRYHVFVCDQQKAEGLPACSARGSAKVLELLRKEVAGRGLLDDVQITACGSLGLCERGPNMIVYPEGIWYSGVTVNDVPEIVESHFREGLPVERLMNTDPAALYSEITGNREKMMARIKSAGLPDSFQQTIRGFQESRVILTAIELDAFSAVGDSATAAEAAKRMRTNPRATEMLFNALAAMGLLEKRNGTFRNSAMAARYLAEGSPDDSRAALMHIANMWRRWSTMTDAVSQGTAVAYEEMASRGDDWTKPFIAAMDKNARERAPQVVQAVGVNGVSRMLDVGGGSAAYSIAFAQASPGLQADVFDLPTVAPLAQGHIDAAGLAGRVRVLTGDLRSDDFGTGYDLVFVSAICHMLGEEENADLLRRCRKALAPGGRVAIQDFLMETGKTAPKSGALFALNMLVATQNGSSYSVAEYEAWLRAAGLDDIRHVELPGPSGLMIGTLRS